MKLSRREILRQICIIIGLLWLTACSIPTRQILPLSAADYVNRLKINKTIALLGGTGMVGRYILHEALIHGYNIRVLTRSPAKLESIKDQITVIKGNARNLLSIEKLLKGSDLVISALGPVKADGAAAKNISTIATGKVIQVMQKQNIKRYILVSGAAVTMPGDDRNFKGWMIKKLAQLALYDTVRDKQSEYELLEGSPIQWTLVRCPLIDAKPYQHRAKVSLDTPASFHLRAGELARFIIEQIDSREYIKKGPFLGSP